MYAASVPNSDYFKIRKTVLEHKCDIMSRSQYTKHVTEKVISELMKSKYVNGAPGPRACNLLDLVLQELHMTVTYWKAWQVKELAMEMTQGLAEESYMLLPVYIHILKKSNPGTLCNL